MNKKMFFSALLLKVLCFSAVLLLGHVVRVEAAEKYKPVAQVYRVEGDVTVKKGAGRQNIKVEQGSFLGISDLLTLAKGSAVGIYFKDGGKREISAREGVLTHKVADILSETGRYDRVVPSFGATRSLNRESERDAGVESVFYPQETMVVGLPPEIEMTIFDSSGNNLHVSKVEMSVSHGDKVVLSKTIADAAMGVSYKYICKGLDAGKEYGVDVHFQIDELPEQYLSFTSMFYLAAKPAGGLPANSGDFADSAYRSAELASIFFKDREYLLWFLKSIKVEGAGTSPVILMDILIE